MVNKWPKLVALNINLIKYILNAVLDDCCKFNIIVNINTKGCTLSKLGRSFISWGGRNNETDDEEKKEKHNKQLRK
jgi:hypothetical protein